MAQEARKRYSIHRTCVIFVDSELHLAAPESAVVLQSEEWHNVAL